MIINKYSIPVKRFKDLLDQQKGITLTELIVASILVGIIMIGVISFSFTLKQLQTSTNNSTILAMHTSALMSDIERNAMLASGNLNNKGIDVSLDKKSISFRQDLAGTPDNPDDDKWFIYKAVIDGDDHELIYCSNKDTPDDCQVGQARAISMNIKDVVFERDDAQGTIHIKLVTIFDTHMLDNPNYIENPSYTMSSHISPQGQSW